MTKNKQVRKLGEIFKIEFITMPSKINSIGNNETFCNIPKNTQAFQF